MPLCALLSVNWVDSTHTSNTGRVRERIHPKCPAAPEGDLQSAGFSDAFSQNFL